jgi:hypothetical protein
MDDRKSRRNPVSDPERYALRVLRVNAGESLVLRLLQSTYHGILTHYLRKRSWVCEGEDCPAARHHTPSQWRGYVPANLWHQDSQLWYPTVLELTEHAELDLRGRLERGQLWCFSRAPDGGDRHFPVTATLIGGHDPDIVPAPFDVLPVVRTLYRAPYLVLDKDNPMPAKTFVVPIRGEAPTDSGAPQSDRLSPLELHRLIEERRSRPATRKETNNGKSHVS